MVYEVLQMSLVYCWYYSPTSPRNNLVFRLPEQNIKKRSLCLQFRVKLSPQYFRLTIWRSDRTAPQVRFSLLRTLHLTPCQHVTCFYQHYLRQPRSQVSPHSLHHVRHPQCEKTNQHGNSSKTHSPQNMELNDDTQDLGFRGCYCQILLLSLWRSHSNPGHGRPWHT